MFRNEFLIGAAKVRFAKGDITEIAKDAIVNAANRSLMGGGGVDGAIHSKGGSQILEECKRIRATQWPEGLPTGKAVITSGGKLKAKYVIHTVGPVWHGGNWEEAVLLEQAYSNSMQTAVANRLKTVAFSSISTGACGYPIREAAYVAVKAVRKFLEERDQLSEVTFVLFSQHDFQVYLEAAKNELC